MIEKQPEIIDSAKVNVRRRELSDDHFEFRGGGGATPGGDDALPKHEDMPLAREARLRPEHAQIYPCLVPDVWELAAIVVEKVIAWRLQQRKGLVTRDRVLNPRHFDFRESYRPPAAQPAPRWYTTNPEE